MAENRKKSSSAKSRTKKQSSSKKAVRKNEKEDIDFILSEIFYIVLILIFAVIFIGNFIPQMVIFGPLAVLLRGLFGLGSYFISILAIWYLLWEIKTKNKKLRKIKLIGIIVLFFGVIIFAHILGGKDSSYFGGGFNLFKGLFKEGAAYNGGAIGGLIACKMIDGLTFGMSILVILIVMIIGLILFTGKSFFNAMSAFAKFLFKTDDAEEEAPKKKLSEAKKASKEEKQISLDEIKQYEKPKEYGRAEYEEISRRPKKKGIFNFIVGKETPDSEIEAEKASRYFEEKEKDLERIKKESPSQIDEKSEKVPFVFDLNESQIVGYEDKPKKEISINPDTTIEEALEKTEEEVYEEIPSEEEIFAEEDTEDFEETYEEVSVKIEEETPLYEEGEEPLIDVPLDSSEEAKSAGVIASAGDTPISEKTEPKDSYLFPPIDLLNINTETKSSVPKEEMLLTAKKLEETLLSFGVSAKVIQINRGPTVTRYELSPGVGVKVSKIAGLADDIALNLAAAGIRIEAPIPGKAAVGIEVPNKNTSQVLIRDVIDTEDFKNASSKISFALGQDIAGNTIIPDISKMPHMLIAGATGSGKSVCINTIITSIIYKANPEDVKLILVDPKVVELSVYNGIPHLMLPVVTDPKKAAGALNWGVREMLMRYQRFAEKGVRDISGYNNYIDENPFCGEKKMPQIVIIVDELADLMMAAPGEVEDAICRLAQMARAAGMHLIIATQRPSVDVITGVIKANIPSRIAFSVSSGVDSRTIIDMIGAEKLLGKGDMLFYPMGLNKPLRVQGAFISDKEVENIVRFVKGAAGDKNNYDQKVMEEINSSAKLSGTQGASDLDEFYDEAVELVVEKGKASASMLQRQFRIGYNRASRLIEDLENNGVVGPEDGSKPRKVLLSKEDYNKVNDNEERE